MKRMVGFGVLFLSTCLSALSQVDTTFIYNTSMPYGTLDLRLAKSASRYYYLQEDTTFSFREISPGVRSTTYRDMTSWDSSPYRQGNLREKNGNSDLFIMNYRVLFPQGFNENYEPGYPIIIMLHGAGEAGNCWGDNCHWATRSWDPNVNNPPAPSTELELLNNDRNLFHGGQIHMNAVKAAGTRLPDDPGLSATAFPGIVLFPQSLNGWSQPSKVEDALRILRLIIKKYNVDENRVYIHGLSNGGGGVNQALKRAPWLFACSATMSAISDGEIVLHNQLSEAKKLPMWIFQGGQDTNPTPSRTFSFVKKLRDAGAVIRYYLYPNLGHGTWNTAYKEPDFFSWILSNRKYNPHVSYGNPVICNTTGTGVRLSFSNGFLAYQWEKDGVIVNEEISSEFVASSPGIYRGRFSRRSSNPSDDEWERWSDPIEVSAINPGKPGITVTGSTHLRGPGLVNNEANNAVVLAASEPSDLYNWYKNGQLINFQNTDIDDTLRVARISTGSTSANGAYTLVIRKSYCPSPASDPVYLFFNNSAPVNMTLNSAEVNFRGQGTSSTVFLTWNDKLTNETGYEIWRRKGIGEFSFVSRTEKDAVSFLDTGLEPGTLYGYKLRAINNAGRSNYVPSDNLNTNYQITTLADTDHPLPPQNVQMVTNDITAITLSWTAASDEVGIREYIISYGDTSVTVPATPTGYTITGLQPNTLYPISIQARDFAGHISQPSNQVIGSTYVLSLVYKHSTGAWTDLDDTTLTKTFIHPEFQGTIENFSLAPRTQEDFFNFQFTGYLNVSAEGKYVFRTTSDDGSRLIIDTLTVVDNDGKHGNRTITSDSVFLTAGLHKLEVQYFDNNGFHNLAVQYAGPGIMDGKTFVNIPDDALKSASFTPPPIPDAPINPAAVATGMQSVSISWEFADDDQTDFEIFRSEQPDGPFIMVARAENPSAIDSTALLPGTVYYYQIRTIDHNGASSFTTVVNAETLPDNMVPTPPANLEVRSKTYTAVALAWTNATDNISVHHYEIFANGVLLGSSPINSFTATELTGITYAFTVKAFDTSGNASEFSAPLVVDNTISGMFYSLPTGNLNALATWRKNADGTGPSPTSFGTNGQTFVILNRATTGLGGPWNVSGDGSRIVVPDSVALTIDHSCSCPIELQGASTLKLDHGLAPSLVSISEESTVEFNGPTNVPAGTYGNLTLSGPAKVIQGDSITVMGNLSVNSGTLVNENLSAPGSFTVHGNVSLGSNGSDVYNNINLSLSPHSLHSLHTNGDLHLFGIRGNENSSITVNTNAKIIIALGSPAGGGLRLAGGSLFNIGANDLRIIEQGTINPGSGSGTIAVNNGNITILSGSEYSSHLYFDQADHLVENLKTDLSGTGKVLVQTPVDISGRIQIINGELNSMGNIRLLSTALQTASIDPIENQGALTGEVSVQRYLPVSGKIWRDISVPVSGVTVQKLQEYFPVTGSFSGASSGDDLPSDPSMFEDNGTRDLIPFPPANGSNTATLEKGKGYATFMYALHDSIGTTVQIQGEPFQGNIAFDLIPGTGDAATGWNLIGNPYASPVVWNDAGWTASGVSPVIAMRESYMEEGATINVYRYYHSKIGGVIKAGQAFWVHAGVSPTLEIHERAKTEGSDTIASAISCLKIDVKHGNKSDAAYLIFSEDGIDGHDAGDGVKFQNDGTFSFSSFTQDGVKVAFNQMSSSFACAKEIALDLQNATPGTYSMSFSQIGSAPSVHAFLQDNLNGTTSLVTGEDYSFEVTSDPASSGPGRFALIMTNQLLNVDSVAAETSPVCPGQNAFVTVNNSRQDVEYAVVDSLEHFVSPVVTGNDGAVTLEIAKENLVAGTNKVKLQARFSGCEWLVLPDEILIQYDSLLEVTVMDEVSICAGEDVTLRASGTPDGGHYQWYDAYNNPIAGASDSLLVLSAVINNQAYSVESITVNGCKSNKRPVLVRAVSPAIPVITQSNDTLFSSIEGTLQWRKDGMNLEGATASYLVPADSGLYSVVHVEDECPAESAQYKFSISLPDDGTDDDEDDDEQIVGTQPDANIPFNVEIYPVPGDGRSINILLQTASKNALQIKVISATGIEKARQHVNVTAARTDITITPYQILPDGVYIVITRQGSFELRKKIIVRN